MFVEGNAERLQGWLELIAEGIPKLDKNGVVIPGEYKVEPNPAKAFELFNSVIEYHIPKLARTELAGDPDNPIKVDVLYLKDAPDAAPPSS